MADQLDQLNDAQAAVQKDEDPIRTKVVCSYVYQYNGKWNAHTFLGSLADCSEAFIQEVNKKGIMDLKKVPWARGYRTGNLIDIHPKNDARAEAEVRRVMATNPKAIPVDMV